MTTKELLDLKIELATDTLERLRTQTRATFRGLGIDQAMADAEPAIQNAHGYLNALADIRAELAARGLL